MHAEIRRKIRQAKATWHNQECEEIEDYDRRHDLFHLHKKVKEVTGTTRKAFMENLEDRDGKLIMDPRRKLER